MAKPAVLRSVLIFSFVFLVVAPVAAQSGRARVRDLNQRAMTAYGNLELDEAESLLEQALRVAQAEGVTGAELARTYVNLGILAIGGFQDNGRAMDWFTRAVQADASVQLDPLLSTPEIASLFQLARARAGSAPASTPPPTTGVAPAQGGLVHTAPLEQQVHTAIPVYVEVPAGMDVTRMQLRYRGNGMRSFRELAMEPMASGFGVEIPCAEVFEPAMEYYIVAFSNRTRAGTVGSDQAPIRVRVVARRSGPAPALPGRQPPSTCSQDECPPGLAGCERGGTTTPPTATTAAEAEAPSSDTVASREPPRFFLHLGVGVGAGYASRNMLASDAPMTVGSPEDAAYIPPGVDGCDAPTGRYCVRVTSPGFVPIYGARVYVGYWVHPRVAISVGMRYQIAAGDGTLSHMLLAFRAHGLLTTPRETGFSASVYFGMGTGQIQLRPLQESAVVGETVRRPWAETGLGSTQLGLTLTYRFLRNVGVFVNPEAFVFYREVTYGLELNLGAEIAF